MVLKKGGWAVVVDVSGLCRSRRVERLTANPNDLGPDSLLQDVPEATQL